MCLVHEQYRGIEQTQRLRLSEKVTKTGNLLYVKSFASVNLEHISSIRYV